MNRQLGHDKRNLTMYTLAIVAAAFLISGLLVVTVGRRTARYLMWHPSVTDDRINGEFHLVPRRGDFEDRVELYIDEYFLGPQTVLAERVLPDTFGFDRVIWGGDRTLFVDLSPEPFRDTEIDIRRLDTFLDLLERGIRHNFRRVRRVTYTIGGQVPKEITFRIGER